ncbi:hypothetical protein KQH82_02725 [bacterium]|jgi:hypothetical protein|nr:hypothetical protein [bacterium]
MKANRSLTVVVLTYAILLFAVTGFGVFSAPTTAYADNIQTGDPIGSDTLPGDDTTGSTNSVVEQPSTWDLFLIMIENVVL